MHHLERHEGSSRGGVRETAGNILRHLIFGFRRIVLAGLLFVVACGPDSGGWSPAAPLSTPRTEVAVAALDGKIYAAGGFVADGKNSNVVEVYDVRADRWMDSPSLPVALDHAALVAAEGALYVIGGYLRDGTASGGVWSWTPPSGAWNPETDLPTARGALAAVAVAGRIYAVGGATNVGRDRRLTPVFETYDIETRRWSALPPFPAPRDHLAAAAIGGLIYVVGGRELSPAHNRARLDIFDPSSGRWSRGPDMPTPRGGLAAASAGGRLFVFGGEEPRGTFEEAEVFDPAARRWTTVEPLPTPRHGLGAAVIGNRIYVVGGGPSPGLSVSGANETLKVER